MLIPGKEGRSLVSKNPRDRVSLSFLVLFFLTLPLQVENHREDAKGAKDY